MAHNIIIPSFQVLNVFTSARKNKHSLESLFYYLISNFPSVQSLYIELLHSIHINKVTISDI